MTTVVLLVIAGAVGFVVGLGVGAIGGYLWRWADEVNAPPKLPRATMADGSYGWRCTRCPDAGPWDTLAELDAHVEAVGCWVRR